MRSNTPVDVSTADSSAGTLEATAGDHFSAGDDTTADDSAGTKEASLKDLSWMAEQPPTPIRPPAGDDDTTADGSLGDRRHWRLS